MRESNIEEQKELNEELTPTKTAKKTKQKTKSEGLKNFKIIVKIK